jgi:hypothetical protein
MNDDNRDFTPGDILIDGDRIAGVDRKIDAADAFVIDAKGMIAIPGMIDTHRHTWQSTVHAVGPDWLLNDYFRVMRGVLGPVYRPQDLYVATRLGALEAIDSGTTTLVDWAHLMNTPAHADASVHALRDTNIRAVFGYGNSNAGFQLPNTIRLDAADAKRVRDQYFTGSGLVTMALAVRGPDYSPEEVWMDDFKAARALGLPITVHVGSNGSYSYSVGTAQQGEATRTRHHSRSLRLIEGRRVQDDRGFRRHRFCFRGIGDATWMRHHTGLALARAWHSAEHLNRRAERKLMRRSRSAAHNARHSSGRNIAAIARPSQRQDRVASDDTRYA